MLHSSMSAKVSEIMVPDPRGFKWKGEHHGEISHTERRGTNHREGQHNTHATTATPITTSPPSSSLFRFYTAPSQSDELGRATSSVYPEKSLLYAPVSLLLAVHALRYVGYHTPSSGSHPAVRIPLASSDTTPPTFPHLHDTVPVGPAR